MWFLLGLSFLFMKIDVYAQDTPDLFLRTVAYYCYQTPYDAIEGAKVDLEEKAKNECGNDLPRRVTRYYMKAIRGCGVEVKAGFNCL